MNNHHTLLRLWGIGVAPYSARGITQTLRPIGAAAALNRTVIGELLDFSEPQFRKYASTISCTDQTPPVCDGVWPGRQVTVDCVSELCYPEYGGSPGRPVVPDSEREEAGFIFYRPRLVMRVIGLNDMSTFEYEARVGWSMDLEEV